MTPDPNSPAGRRRLAALWTALFALNLPVALIAAAVVGVWTPGGWAGIAAGLAPAWAVGFAATLVGPRSRRAAWAGAAVVALMQLVPVLHFVAGSLAIGTCCWGGLPDPDFGDTIHPIGPHHAFALTVLTSVPLLAFAAVIGVSAVVLTDPRPGYQGYEAPPEPDE